MVLPTEDLHIRMPVGVMKIIKQHADSKGLSPAMMARSVLCEQFKEVKK